MAVLLEHAVKLVGGGRREGERLKDELLEVKDGHGLVSTHGHGLVEMVG